MAQITRRLIVHGRVQGVFYRGWTESQARDLGLSGWVRNRRDGTVEILARGEEKAIEMLAERCKEGPLAARVDRVEIREADEATPDGFEQRPTV